MMLKPTLFIFFFFFMMYEKLNYDAKTYFFYHTMLSREFKQIVK
jgi:hypothetical protein